MAYVAMGTQASGDRSRKKVPAQTDLAPIFLYLRSTVDWPCFGFSLGSADAAGGTKGFAKGR